VIVPLTVRMTRVSSVMATVTAPVSLWTSMLSLEMPITTPRTGVFPPRSAALGITPMPSASKDVSTTARRRAVMVRSYERRLKTSSLVPESFLRVESDCWNFQGRRYREV
jgi:hypothetical protein